MADTEPWPARGNVLTGLPDARTAEVFESLWTAPGLRIERIVSRGQATAEGQWYDQAQDEWVLVLRGAARLLLERSPDQTIDLQPGDWLWIPAHCRHRVEWTDPNVPTLWLAVHHNPEGLADP
ncbi:MAG: cupin domain-containing protein [Halothiobacillaceae bacterium]